MTDRLRNLFHQYSLDENRITHALAHALVSDRVVLRQFIRWATGRSVRTPYVIVQDRSADQDSIPDITLRTNSGFKCAVENKIYPRSVETDQLLRHWNGVTSDSNGDGCVLVITPDADEPEGVAEARRLGADTRWLSWSAVYTWMTERKTRPDSSTHVLIAEFCRYLRFGENQLQNEGRQDVMLTPFDGIHFEAGVRDDAQVRSLLTHLRRYIESDDEMKQLYPGTNPETGGKHVSFWTYIGLISAPLANDANVAFNKRPHLTIEFEEEQFSAFIVLPHAAFTEYKTRARLARSEDWQKALLEIQQHAANLTEETPPISYVRIVQRHWRSISARPVVDGEVEFTLDTLSDATEKVTEAVKSNDIWASIVPSLIGFKRANIEVQVGLHYPYVRCKELLTSSTFPQHLVKAVGTIYPFFQILTEDQR